MLLHFFIRREYFSVNRRSDSECTRPLFQLEERFSFFCPRPRILEKYDCGVFHHAQDKVIGPDPNVAGWKETKPGMRWSEKDSPGSAKGRRVAAHQLRGGTCPVFALNEKVDREEEHDY
jgi:hypothetical protein